MTEDLFGRRGEGAAAIDMDARWRVTFPPDFADLAGVDPVALVQAGGAASFCVTVHPSEYERPSPTARPVRDHFEPSLKLDSILVERGHQNKGAGTRLLRAAVRYAELKGLPLWLCAIGDERLAYGGDGVFMTTERLVQWYGRYGFELVADGEGERYGIDCGRRRVAMIRYPGEMDRRC
ncbi:GNAT family N-acetyltransferase [Mycobacteroides abscessus subsp. abscessus]|uniref:GNAT family N-acetyltransferase n=1 Tax=Mycobacteroides abscessus TaxID=36809 RepID=UPI0009A8CE57|nr:GNAT family N-acetyltransferase [Mycobacteroides abscessus]MBN7388544.1 GNAT family N-acetyltransferase [Mycobacteroides abscessus subsp. abscessus]MBN7414814.1 GNAT family N-acetyltransferase [Mycobacteroides abscessus subsp. abscessus]MDO2961034.1 GNAT family N-acetyltransferase [Mycobacteroides abscessus subsp. abscessus]MDO2995002.1 GNAT family N-acetyltransferase [Mycobacteroides abscessus subsp. abscessus]MDO3064345.1 GNAT family N-acetyltransferase [Mycobacteroides abscessus subsp. a